MSFWSSNKGAKPDEARELTIQRIGMHATGRGEGDSSASPPTASTSPSAPSGAASPATAATVSPAPLGTQKPAQEAEPSASTTAGPAAAVSAPQPTTPERGDAARIDDSRDEAAPTPARSTPAAMGEVASSRGATDASPVASPSAPPTPAPASSPPAGAFRAALEAAVAEEAAHTARIAELQAEIKAVSTRRDEVAGVARSLRGYLGESSSGNS